MISFEELRFTHVRFQPCYVNSQIWFIHFVVNGYRMKLMIGESPMKKCKPLAVYHTQETFYIDDCYLCKKGAVNCDFFVDGQLDQLFETLISFPSVRLHWLFIEK